MPEILTESFCERCGTRYTFESTAPRKTRRLGQFKTLGKGVKNWVMSDDSSLDEAMAEARSDDERELTTQQLDAFHSTFNFCMSCRQYTCANCWNTADGRCLSCAPNLGQEILPAPFPDAPVFEPVRIEVEAWPEVDLSSPAASADGAGLGIEGLPANGIHANGNGFHPMSNGRDSGDDIPQFDAAARLAFLSGETLAPPPPPEPVPPEPVAPEPVAFEVAPPEEAVSFEAAPPELVRPEPVAEAPAAPEPVEVAPIAAEPFRAEPDVLVPMATEAVAAEPVAVDPIGAAQPLADAPAAVIDDVAGEAAATPTGSAPIDPLVEKRAATGAARTSDLLTRFRPGQSIDAELAAYEAQRASEPVAESAVEADPAVVDLSPAATWQDAAEPESAPVVEAVAATAEAPVAQPQVDEPEHPGVAAVVAGGLLAADLANPVREAEQVAAEPAVVEPVAVAEPAPAEPVDIAETVAAEPVVVAEPVAVERVAPEPVAVEPVPIEPIAVEPVAVEPVAVEPVAVEAVAVEPLAPEPVAVEPVAAELVAAEPAPVAAPEPLIAPLLPVREDRIEQPTWQIFAPDQVAPAGQSAPVPVAPTPAGPAPARASSEPQWPVRVDFEESPSMALLANPSRRSSDDMWAASSREVLAVPAQGGAAAAAPGVQPCSSCGLSLSSTARFCRRCGTRQG